MVDVHKAFAEIAPHWKIPTDLPYFQGHFPGNPIFPAVGIVDASFVLIRKKLSNPRLALIGMSTSKFMNPMGPGQEVQIDLKEINPGEWEAVWKDKEKTFGTVRLKVAEESP